MRSSTSSFDGPPSTRQVLRYLGFPVLVSLLVLTGVEAFYRAQFGSLGSSTDIQDLKSVEGYRQALASPDVEILGLGDSRFETAFDPETVAKASGRQTKALNLAVSSGNVLYQMEELVKLDCRDRTLVVLTTPGTVLAWQGRIKAAPRMESWYYRVERWLTHLCNSHLLIANGQPLFFYTLGLRKTVNIQQPDGWLKVVTRRDRNTVDAYVLRKWVEDHSSAPAMSAEWQSRFESLLEELTRRNNRIIMVRSPVMPEVREVTNRYYPRFDEVMQEVAERHGLSYFPAETFELHSGISYDGVHYDYRRARELSRQLGELLNEGAHGSSRGERDGGRVHG